MHIFLRCLWLAAFAVPGVVYGHGSVPSPVLARSHACEAYLRDGPYGTGLTHDLYLAPSERLTLEPEFGSIEDRHPGIVNELMRLFHVFAVVRQRGMATHDPRWPTVLHALAERIRTLPERYPDSRLPPMLERLYLRIAQVHQYWVSRHPRLSYIADESRQIESNLWELLVACFFAGRRIHLNENISELYPREFARFPRQQADGQPLYLDRELDIAIERSDGSWRWIEVKNWRLETARDFGMQEKIFKQARGLEDMRRRLVDHDVQLDLVMRHGLDGADYLRFQRRTAYHQILFVFPEN